MNQALRRRARAVALLGATALTIILFAQGGPPPVKPPTSDSSFSGLARKSGNKVFVAFFRPAKDSAPPLSHREFVQEMTSRKRFLMVGRFSATGEEMAILQAKSEEEAKDLVRSDPAVSGGNLKVEVRPYSIYADSTQMAAAAPTSARDDASRRPPGNPPKRPN